MADQAVLTPSGWVTVDAPHRTDDGAERVSSAVLSGTIGSAEFSNPASGALSSLVFPTGVSVVQIELVNLGSTNLDVIYVVFDAFSAADATAKLGFAATREIVPVGSLKEYRFTTPISRLDLISNEATPSGAAVAKVNWTT
jgi:hypothetical protein